MSKQTRQIGGVQLSEVQKEQLTRLEAGATKFGKAAQKAKSRFSLTLTEWVQAEREHPKALQR
jgi:hypothetical protein